MTRADRGAGNRLAAETSPYLRQHADNPVDWQPWDAAALDEARTRGKPILLSIGYAACHWCHVMAHESFEDAATAAVMNEHFVNIKVDREERPDLDRIYQLAHQMMSGRGGGWPLTVLLTHDDQRPWFAGTYFPPAPRHGLPAFADLLLRASQHYRTQQAELREHAGALVAALDDLNPPPAGAGEALSAAPIAFCRKQLEQSFDSQWGGFGGAPKFPHAPLVQRLLRDWRASAGSDAPDLQALYMASLTLTRMAEGVLFDQLGGGFCRYSVDERWEIPHFEKMLYDNALLLGAYAEAAGATGEPLFAEVATRTAAFMLDELRAPGGAFYSSLDADAAGVEGSFYVWEREAVRAALTPAEHAVFAPHHGLDRAPNFEHHAHHLVVATSLAAVAQTLGIDEAEATARLASARAKLLALRSQRERPGRDEKLLSSWNALAIRGLATAARCLARDDLAQAAGEALGFLRARHWRSGRLLATSAGGEARLPAYLDDYAFLADAVLELATVRFDAQELAFAVELAEAMLAHFEDAQSGGFWFTADDHEALVARPKTFGDDALPPGNGVAAFMLQRLGALLGEPRYLEAAERCLRAGWPALARYPSGHATMLQALEESLDPPQCVILRGEPALVGQWRRELARGYAPRRFVLAIPAGATGLPPALALKAAPASGALAYVCRGTTCGAPLASLAALVAVLER